MSMPRHDLPAPRESFIASIQKEAEYLDRELGGEAWKGEWTPSYFRTAFNNGCLRAYVNPNDPAIWLDLERCACLAAAAHVAAITSGTESIRAPRPGGGWAVVTRSAGKPKQLEPAVQWRAGLLASVATRNSDALAMLVATRIEDLLRVSRSAPSWFESEARALAAVFQLDTGAADLMRHAAQIAETDRTDQRWPHEVVVPEMELGLRALERDARRFDVAMVRAVELHHHYYGSEGKDIFHGQLALAPLAMACFGSDRGLHTTVESDYLPRWIIERSAP